MIFTKARSPVQDINIWTAEGSNFNFVISFDQKYPLMGFKLSWRKPGSNPASTKYSKAYHHHYMRAQAEAKMIDEGCGA